MIQGQRTGLEDKLVRASEAPASEIRGLLTRLHREGVSHRSSGSCATSVP